LYQNRIIAAAHNLCVTLKDATAHAEILAIRQALQNLQQPYLTDCDIYVTLEPCHQCASALALVRIRKLYFGAYDPKGGGVEHGARIFQYSLHQPEVIGGINEKHCKHLLLSFFQTKR
jgi:tRNA(adenine34) deaminase